MMQIVLASHNKHKQEELSAMLDGIAECILLDDFPEIDETGDTLDANAMLKAKAVHEHYKKPSLADDTGLEVAALNGKPGVKTARYAGENATYEDNCRKLLEELSGVTDRRAVFRTAICFVDPNGAYHFFEGRVNGVIAENPRGSNGFGYDPVFIPLDDNPRGLTFAEMTSEMKNTISHRGRALTEFVKWMKKEPNR